MDRNNSDVVWIVVKVESGIPVLAELYKDQCAARKREDQLRAKMNPENDEVGIFVFPVT